MRAVRAGLEGARAKGGGPRWPNAWGSLTCKLGPTLHSCPRWSRTPSFKPLRACSPLPAGPTCARA